jgi:hypothetical protein
VTPGSPEFLAIGLTSGTVYELSNQGGKVFQMILEGAADIEIIHDTEVWIAQDGSSFTVTFGWHYVTNGNGDLVVSREDSWSIDCSD